MATITPITGSPASVAPELQTAAVEAPVVRAPKPAGKSKPRKRVNTAEKRNQHNAIERARRETLNGKFIHLARLLPSLASHRRPSKSAIVNGSISHLGHQREQRLLASRLLRQLCAERDELAAEVNRWRKAGGFPNTVATSAWSDEMEQVCGVEKEVFGTFANVDGEGEGDDGEDDDESNNDAQEQAFIPHTLGVNGLVTPRSSTDMDAISSHQALFGNMPVADKATASINGLSWSQDFAFNLNSSVATSNVSAPFADHSSTSSPANSNPGVYTPPPMGEVLYAQAIQGSSPHSQPSTSAGLVNDKPAVPSQTQTPQWAQQMLLMQLQQAQQEARARSQQAQAAMPFGGFTPAAINGMFNPVPQQQQAQQRPFATNPNANPNAFTQSMLENMFPQHQAQNPSAADIEKWRFMALGNCGAHNALQDVKVCSVPCLLIVMADRQTAVRTGMAMGMNLGANFWPENQAVEGFVA